MKSILFIAIICLTTLPAIAQPANLDFENWYADSAGVMRLSQWEHFSAWPNTLNPGTMFGTWRDSNAQHGNYALKVSRWYSYTNDWLRQKTSIGSRPAAVTGFYEYIDDSLMGGPYKHDTAQVQVFLTKWNTSLNQNDTVGTGYADLSASLHFTPFACNIVYTAAATPDSITLHILPTKWAHGSGVCVSGGTCSYLTIDNLSVSSATAINYIATGGIQAFPNPFDRLLTISATASAGTAAPIQIRIYDIVGQQVYSGCMTGQEKLIDTEKLAKGTYILEITRVDRREILMIVK